MSPNLEMKTMLSFLRELFRGRAASPRRQARLSVENLEGRLALSSPASLVSAAPLGKIIEVGSVPAGPKRTEFEITRLNGNGTLDTTFGNHGHQTVNFYGVTGFGYATATSFTFDRSGDIIVVGTATDLRGNADFAIARLTPSGQLDRGFGTGGREALAAPGFTSSRATSVSVDSSNRIVVSGTVARPGMTFTEGAATRLLASGQLDTSFGNRGWEVFAAHRMVPLSEHLMSREP
jgi:uncharacterized delta-60 repeat protein